jgi:acyl-CoA synthetase (AMP-forming)/AMP-acid ligase II/NAD(P)-dependent dehydrogenase (short-subunit alcohol dehydrogenase family)
MTALAPERPPAPIIPDQTLAEFVLGSADRHGDRRALIDGGTGRAVTYAQLAGAVRQAAAHLSARGVRRGDVIGLCSPNRIEFVVAFYGASSIGAVVTTVNPQWTGEEIVRQLSQTGARRLIASAPVAAKVSGLEIIAIDEFAARTSGGFGIYASYAATSPKTADGARPEDVALLPTSSGTTGLPKSVVLTHRNLVGNLCQMRDALGLTERDVVVAALPLFHIYGLQVTLNLALRAGATVVILPRFELSAFLRAVQDYGVTKAQVVPPIVLALATSPLVDGCDLSSLEALTSGAAPLGADLARACARRLGCRVTQAFGMTELGGGTHIAPIDGPDRPDSVGPALPGIEWRVVDPDTGADLGPDEPGELWLRSAGAMRGYLNDPTATATTIDADGWVHSGDIVTVDEDGWLRITDRIKELIKYKGFQVAPAELEEILLAHPAIADAAVVRSPDREAGEVPKAFLVARRPVSAAEVENWVAARVASYKRIHRVQFVDRIPKSASGKILRRVLVERERERAANTPDLTAHVVLVTGAGRGLGRLLAMSLARAGASVGLLARSQDELSATAAEITEAGGTAGAAAVDVTDRAGVRAAVDSLRRELGPIDVLINNAGVGGPVGTLWDVDASDWWRTLEINLGGAAELTRLVLPDMIAAGRGRVVNITSRAGVYRWPLASAYAASKAGLVKLTETLAVETRRHGVCVFSVDPGLLPIGLGDPARGGDAELGTPAGRVAGWLRERLESGHGADPARAVRLVVDLAAGQGDRLSGRHLSVNDDLATLNRRIEQIESGDLHTLRLRTSAATA